MRPREHGGSRMSVVSESLPQPATKPRVYIAGPMTGLPDYNFPAFHAAAKVLRDEGYDVVNPAEIAMEGDCATWYDCMRRDIPELLKCDGVFVLPGWAESKGARLEVLIAVKLGMWVRSAHTRRDV